MGIHNDPDLTDQMRPSPERETEMGLRKQNGKHSRASLKTHMYSRIYLQ